MRAGTRAIPRGAWRVGLACALLVLLAAWPPAAAKTESPALPPRVVDQAGVLSPADRETLEKRVDAIAAARGTQVGVLLVPTTGAEGAERYAARIREEWKLGQPGRDDGVLILIARDDRRARLDVGPGLAATLTEDAVTRVLLERMTPRLQEGAYTEAIRAAVDSIERLLAGEILPPSSVEPEPPDVSAPNVDPPALLAIAAGSAFIGLFLHFILSPWIAGLLTLAPMVIVALWIPGEVGLVVILALGAWLFAFFVHRLLMRGARASAPGGRKGRRRA